MANFNYEWWTVEMMLDAGRYTCEYKGKSKDHIIRQIEKDVKYTNSEKNLSKPCWERRNQIKEVFWDTLKLDRIGFQRLS